MHVCMSTLKHECAAVYTIHRSYNTNKYHNLFHLKPKHSLLFKVNCNQRGMKGSSFCQPQVHNGLM